jgi:hypothetical protein
VDSAQRGEIESVIQIDFWMNSEATARHRAGARIARLDTDWQYQRVSLKIPNGVRNLPTVMLTYGIAMKSHCR